MNTWMHIPYIYMMQISLWKITDLFIYLLQCQGQNTENKGTQG